MSTAPRITLSDERSRPGERHDRPRAAAVQQCRLRGRRAVRGHARGLGAAGPDDPRVRYFDLVAVRRRRTTALSSARSASRPRHPRLEGHDSCRPRGRAGGGIPGAEHVELAGAGHHLYREQPDAARGDRRVPGAPASEPSRRDRGGRGVRAPAPLRAGQDAVPDLAESARGALADAGLTIADVDGFATSGVGPIGVMALAEHLNLQPDYLDSTNIGGSSFVAHVAHAAAAIGAGSARSLIIYGSTAASERFAVGTGGGARRPARPLRGAVRPDGRRRLRDGRAAPHARVRHDVRAARRDRRHHAPPRGAEPGGQVPRPDHRRGRARLAHRLVAAASARLLHHLRRRRRARRDPAPSAPATEQEAGLRPRRRRGGAPHRDRPAKTSSTSRPSSRARRRWRWPASAMPTSTSA